MVAESMFEKSGASFSDCRTWRYALWRNWDWQGHANCVMFIGLNPSTAGETDNDTTISKEIGFAKRWGFGGIIKLNLYAFVTAYPKIMVAAPDPVGPGNDEAFSYYRNHAGLYVAAWGSLDNQYRPNLQWQSRIKRAMECIGRPVYCLGRTQDGSPRHTSRRAYSAERELFWSPPRPQPERTEG